MSSDDEIMLLGRWKSDTYKLYSEMNARHILAASRRLQKTEVGPARTPGGAPQGTSLPMSGLGGLSGELMPPVLRPPNGVRGNYSVAGLQG